MNRVMSPSGCDRQGLQCLLPPLPAGSSSLRLVSTDLFAFRGEFFVFLCFLVSFISLFITSFPLCPLLKKVYYIFALCPCPNSHSARYSWGSFQLPRSDYLPQMLTIRLCYTTTKNQQPILPYKVIFTKVTKHLNMSWSVL